MSLTQDQTNVLEAAKLMLLEDHPVLVVDGSAGTGKTTLIKEILNLWKDKQWAATLRLTNTRPKKIEVTATTNKAVDSLKQATGHECRTLHSFLKIKMQYGKPVYPPITPILNTLLIIDEYSYIDSELLDYLMKSIGTSSSVIFVGDHAQLAPVGSRKIPVAARGFPTIELKEQVRQETSVLKEVAESLKQYVLDGEFPELKPDGKSFIHYEDSENEAFADAMVEAFKKGSARFLSFTNERTLEVSKFLFEELENRTSYQEGDYMVNNKFFKGAMGSIKTDATVRLTRVDPGMFHVNHEIDGITVTDTIPGLYVDTSGFKNLFIPKDYKAHIHYANAKMQDSMRYAIDTTWVDFRPQYACTVHKSQGSTYDRVFLDLSDFANVSSSKSLSRLLYVAMSRARKEIHVIGNL
ncbi:MAG: AAA family ATPase [Caryophanon sp.]|nr:AAA family ATPase [Caryophanon sp.]